MRICGRGEMGALRPIGIDVDCRMNAKVCAAAVLETIPVARVSTKRRAP